MTDVFLNGSNSEATFLDLVLSGCVDRLKQHQNLLQILLRFTQNNLSDISNIINPKIDMLAESGLLYLSNVSFIFSIDLRGGGSLTTPPPTHTKPNRDFTQNGLKPINNTEKYFWKP